MRCSKSQSAPRGRDNRVFHECLGVTLAKHSLPLSLSPSLSPSPSSSPSLSVSRLPFPLWRVAAAAKHFSGHAPASDCGANNNSELAAVFFVVRETQVVARSIPSGPTSAITESRPAVEA